MMWKSILVKLWVTITIFAVAILVTFGALSAQLFQDFFYRHTAMHLTDQATGLAPILAHDRNPLGLAFQPDQAAMILGARIVVVEPEELRGSLDPADPVPGPVRPFTPSEARRLLAGQVVVHDRPLSRFGYEILGAAAPIIRNGATNGAIFVYAPVGEVAETIDRMRRLIFNGVLAVLGFSAVLAFFLSRTLAEPLIAMNRVARLMAEGDFSGKVRVRSSDELGRLGSTLNHLSERLQGTLSALSGEKEKLASILRCMTEFVGDVSHELRTPLSLIQTYAQALLDRVVDGEAEKDKYLETVLEETLRLQRLVNQLLDLTQLEAGQMPIRREPFSLDRLIERLVRKMAPRALETGITLEVSPSGDLPLALGDEDRVEQVLINLVDNALRYTPPGGRITLAAAAGPDRLTVQVRDSGQGIPACDLPHIFDRFYRVDKARSRNSGGTGLGLAIVRNIVEAHGGRITAESAEGAGSTFSFTLSVTDPDPAVGPDKPLTSP